MVRRIAAKAPAGFLARDAEGSVNAPRFPIAARAPRQDPTTLGAAVINPTMELAGALLYFTFAWSILGRLLAGRGGRLASPRPSHRDSEG